MYDLLGSISCYLFPNCSSTTVLRETKHSIGTPSTLCLVSKNIFKIQSQLEQCIIFEVISPQHILNNLCNIGSGDTFPEPRTLHERRWHSPNFVIIWAHENIGNSLAHHTHDPFIEVCRWALSKRVGNFRFNQAIDTLHLRYICKPIVICSYTSIYRMG